MATHEPVQKAQSRSNFHLKQRHACNVKLDS